MKNLKIKILLVLIVSFSIFQLLLSDSASKYPGEYPAPYPDRIVATWNDYPSTTLAVTWRTDTTIKRGIGIIAAAKAEPKFHSKADTFSSKIEKLNSSKVDHEFVKANYHTAVFNDLKPSTLYAYKVGTENNWSEWFHVKTASLDPEPFHFIYLGDAQNDILSHWSRVIRAAYAEQPNASFLIHAGDLINYAHSNVEWGEWNLGGAFIQSMIPSIAVPGNHEYWRYTDKSDAQRHLSIHWRNQFEFPLNGPEGLEETAYYIDYQGMRIIALNSNRKIREQSRWLEKILKDNPNRWTVATHHHPIYSSGQGRNNKELRAAWQPIYSKYGVDLVMQGHDHTYARGRSRNVAKGVNVRDSESGTVYVNSVSGAKMYNMRKNGWKPLGGKLERSAENSQLYQIISVSRDTLKFRSYTATGELYDSFDIVQQENQKANKIIENPVEVGERTFKNTIKY